MFGHVTNMCVLVYLIQAPVFTYTDNLALLTGTLKTMQRAACDDETVSLSCPRSTAITIQVAQYGKMSQEGHTCQTRRSQRHQVESHATEKCLWPNSMQYSLLQTVVEACQKKPQCKFSTQPKPGLVDPCPYARKFVEVAYKCRPNEFRIQTVCEDDVVKLKCNPQSRIAVYDAQYGRTAYEPITCPQPQGVNNKTCMAAHATETVMQHCHGARQCEVKASKNIFGTPCEPNVKTNLKIVYACVPLGVLTDRYERPLESDEVPSNSISHDDHGLFDDRDDAGEKWGEPNVVPPAPAIASPTLKYPELVEGEKLKNYDDINTQEAKKDNAVADRGTNIYVYIGIGITFIFIIIAAAVIIRCYITRRTTQDSKPGDMFTTEAPNVFNDAVSDIDNDIDVTHISGTFYEHPDMILYKDVPGKGTRAMRPLSTIYPCTSSSMYGNVDYTPQHPEFKGHEEALSPKTLQRYSDSQYYFG